MGLKGITCESESKLLGKQQSFAMKFDFEYKNH